MKTPEQIAAGLEPVAVIGKDWQLLWASPEPLSKTVARTGIKIGSPLYAEPNIERMRAVLQAIEKEGMRNHATRCAPWWNEVRAVLQEQADAK